MRGYQFLVGLLFVWCFVEEIVATCNKNFNNLESGNFTSPNFPNPYGTDDCKWEITIAEGNKISLKFLEFDVKSGGDSTCGRNNLEIEDDGQYKTYCNIKKPAGATFYYNSTGNKIIVTFKTPNGNAENNKGFSAEFTAIKPSTTPSLTTTPNTTTTQNTTTTANTNVTNEPTKGGLSGGAIVGICIVCIIVALFIIDLIFYQFKKGVIYVIKARFCS